MTALLAAILLKGTVLMLAAAVVVAVMFRASAASRHFIWTLTVMGLLVLPVFSMTLPTWQLSVRIAPIETRAAIDAVQGVGTTRRAPVRVSSAVASDVRADAPSVAYAPAPLSWPLLLGSIYAFVAIILFGHLGVQRRAATRIVREAAVVTDTEWTSLLDECAARVGVTCNVELRRSRVQLMPMTTGTSAPSIVIPADADTWDADRRRAVLLHELAHIARYDCLTQMLSAIARTVYWFHPGAWYIARRLRIERELACDDRVLSAGAHAREYAGHLLDLAYNWSGRQAPAMAVGMASSRKLEDRMRAVLDPARNRSTPTRRMWIAGAAVAAAALLPLAALTMTTASADMRSELMASSAERGVLAQDRDARTTIAEPPIGSRDNVSGTWEVRRSRTRDYLSVRISGGSFSWNGELSVNDIEQYLAQPLPGGTGPVRFTISREPGSLELEGTMNNGAGSGTFRFIPSETFVAGLTRRGFSRPTAQQLFALAQNEIGFEFIDELAAQKYEQPDIENLVRAAHHGVRTDFLREMGQAGYRVGTLDTLIRLRDHGVDPEYIRGMHAQGVSGLPAEDMVRARDHGVDPEYIGELTRLGYDVRAVDVLIRARDHGVDGEYLRGMRQLGYTFTLDEAIRARDHGIDPEFAGDMRRLGYTLAAVDLIRARDHGVDPTYVEFMALEGYKGLPIETLIRLRDHGVTPDYVREVRKSGRDKLSPDELIRLRDRGDGLERKLGQLNYHVDRLVERLERALNELLQ